MSSQRGNVKKSGPPKYQNKRGFKNVYHDTSIQTKKIVNTEVAGVCKKCKDVIEWKIKYKKYKPLTQLKTCADCKNRTVRHAYHVFCQGCGEAKKKCTKCGEKKDIVQQPSLSNAALASQDRELQFELEQLQERKRRTFMRLQEKGMLTSLGDPKAGGVEEYDDEDSNDELENEDTDADGSGMAPHDALDEVPDHTVAGIKASVTLGHDVTETPCLSDVAETKTATDRKSDDADLCAQTVDLNISSKENVES